MTEDPLSNILGIRLKEVRKAEGLSQLAFGEMTAIPLDTIKGYESRSKQKQVSSATLMKVTNHPEFEKYALWLMTGHVSPEGGQISPEIKLQAAQLKTGS